MDGVSRLSHHSPSPNPSVPFQSLRTCVFHTHASTTIDDSFLWSLPPYLNKKLPSTVWNDSSTLSTRRFSLLVRFVSFRLSVSRLRRPRTLINSLRPFDHTGLSHLSRLLPHSSLVLSEQPGIFLKRKMGLLYLSVTC